jgi:hypothetical protein
MGMTLGYDSLAKGRHRPARAADMPHRHPRIRWSRIVIYAALVAGPWSAIALLALALTR